MQICHLGRGGERGRESPVPPYWWDVPSSLPGDCALGNRLIEFSSLDVLGKHTITQYQCSQRPGSFPPCHVVSLVTNPLMRVSSEFFGIPHSPCPPRVGCPYLRPLLHPSRLQGFVVVGNSFTVERGIYTFNFEGVPRRAIWRSRKRVFLGRRNQWVY